MSAIRTAAVIGGGIAGPVTALALRRAGIEATVYEAYENTADGLGGMLMVAPNGLDALEVVGVERGLAGQPIHRMVMTDGRGRRMGEFGGLTGLPPSRVMWRADLYGAVRERAAAAGVQTVYGKRLAGVEETPGGVMAEFADGTRVTADVLVGADGIRSTVRQLIDPAAPGPRYTGLLGFGAYSEAEVPQARPDTMYFAFGEQAFLGYWPVPGGGTAWFGNLPYDEPLGAEQARATPPAAWMRILREKYAEDVPGRDLLQGTRDDELLTFGGLEILPPVPKWYRGRMVLVGDAAHAPSSSSGQGASLAVESAVQLARCLRDIPDAGAAFAAYEQLRRGRVEKVAAQAAKTNSQKSMGPVATKIMALLMPLATRTFLTPEKMFGWTHRYRIDWDEPVVPA
ncbi:FAD-dependent oxidoreductase [Streptomyces sp. GS7]|uniref:FAD-dependent oxidoreductase n=1 Tax=Streptomyces sp. GS7 TaxID=2692234 RepID=UPI0013189604|nr:NAD(P)/FAD-dependent oxidoreductase [Streptomyces sp. GS7]QHC21300.1 FAD-dependent monooxygenase [Streptomyces sp. GS7]